MSSFIDDFLFALFQQNNEIKKGRYPDGIQVRYEGYIDFKRNLTGDNLIRKWEFDVAVFIVRAISLKGGFWVVNTLKVYFV